MLERLNDPDLTVDQLETEIKRAEAVGKTAAQIIDIADLTYKTMKEAREYGINIETPRLLETN